MRRDGVEEAEIVSHFFTCGYNLNLKKIRQKKATKAGKREIFRKVVMAKATPAKTIVKAFPAKFLKDEF